MNVLNTASAGFKTDARVGTRQERYAPLRQEAKSAEKGGASTTLPFSRTALRVIGPSDSFCCGPRGVFGRRRSTQPRVQAPHPTSMSVFSKRVFSSRCYHASKNASMLAIQNGGGNRGR